MACRDPAEQGDASCQNLMGILFSEGRGVPKNDSEAARWFRKAADQGHGHACFNLGRAYQFGDGVQQSNQEAARWYRRAAELGVPFGLTHSCYDPAPDGAPCGQCDSCLLRRKGFEEAGVEDR